MEWYPTKGKTCCFTGHRNIPEKLKADIEQYLENEIERLSEMDFRDFICGGALGFDTLAAMAVLKVRNRLPAREIRLHLFLPCHEQTKDWRHEDVYVYDAILRRADSVRYISEAYSSGCMHKRNRYMVDRASFCIAYCTKKTGGTAYTVKYAQKSGMEIINLVYT